MHPIRHHRSAVFGAGLVTLLAAAVGLAPAADAAPPKCLGRAATIVGTAASETLNGTTGNDVIVALGGNDTVNGKGGHDVVCAGGGADVVAGDSGDDQLVGEGGNDRLLGGSDDDDFYGGPGNDVIDGGTHRSGHNAFDEVKYTSSTQAVTVNLDNGTATGEGTDTLTGVESARGSSWNDTLIGSTGGFNYLTGGPGHDTVRGEPAGSFFGGGDMLTGSPGDDLIDGGPGRDTVSYTGTPQGVVVDLLNQFGSGDGNDTITSVESIYGSPHADVLWGDSNDNTIIGWGGADEVYGDPGNDTLWVSDGVGDDYVDGGDGSDSCLWDDGDGVVSCP